MKSEIDAVIMHRIKDALQPLEHNWSIDAYCKDLTERAALPPATPPPAAPAPKPQESSSGSGTLTGLVVLCVLLFLALIVVSALVPANSDNGDADASPEFQDKSSS